MSMSPLPASKAIFDESTLTHLYEQIIFSKQPNMRAYSKWDSQQVQWLYN